MLNDQKPWKESEFWETRFRMDDTPWDLGQPSSTLKKFWESLKIKKKSTVLVPGCGLGNDALYLAAQGYRVAAVDCSMSAIEKVRLRARRAKLEIEALNSYVWDTPETWFHSFDAWWEHTFFCAIDPSDRERYAEQVANLLKKTKSHLIGAFFINDKKSGQSISDERVGPPFWTSKKELETLFGETFEMTEIKQTIELHPAVKQSECLVHFIRK